MVSGETAGGSATVQAVMMMNNRVRRNFNDKPRIRI
jgi:hypothetical protein